MLSLTSVLASEVVIGDVADKFKLPRQRVHAATGTVCRRPDSNRPWLTQALKATDLDYSATTLRPPSHTLLTTKLALQAPPREPPPAHTLQCSQGPLSVLAVHVGYEAAVAPSSLLLVRPRPHDLDAGQRAKLAKDLTQLHLRQLVTPQRRI